MKRTFARFMGTGGFLIRYSKVRRVQALRYKPEGRRFICRWCLSDFSLT